VIGAKKGGNVGSRRKKGLAARNSSFDAIASAKYQTGLWRHAEFLESAIVTRQTLSAGGGFFKADDNTDAPMAQFEKMPSSPVCSFRVGLEHGLERILGVAANCRHDGNAMGSHLAQKPEIATRRYDD
jgi:hypothetical protein